MSELKTPTQCRKLLEVAKDSFLKAIRKAQNEKNLNLPTKCEIIYDLETILVLKHLQRPGVVKKMTADFRFRRRIE